MSEEDKRLQHELAETLSRGARHAGGVIAVEVPDQDGTFTVEQNGDLYRVSVRKVPDTNEEACALFTDAVECKARVLQARLLDIAPSRGRAQQIEAELAMKNVVEPLYRIRKIVADAKGSQAQILNDVAAVLIEAGMEIPWMKRSPTSS
jgi:hypothetical protein